MSWMEFSEQYYQPRLNKPKPILWDKSDQYKDQVLAYAKQVPTPPMEQIRDQIYQSFRPENHIGICSVLRYLAQKNSPLSPVRAWAVRNYQDRMDVWLNHPTNMRDALDELRRTIEFDDRGSGLSMYAYRTFYDQIDALIGKGFSHDPMPLAAVAEIMTETIYLDPHDHEYTVTKNQALPRFEKAMTRLAPYDPVLYLSTLALAASYAGGSARFDQTVASLAQRHLPDMLETSRNQKDYLQFLYEAARPESRTQAVFEGFLQRGFHQKVDRQGNHHVAVLVPRMN
ncbi:MAG: hypothetical protein H6868_01680 [Rhodospirillales bacterium]|nr:hypothetical protein [Rhodospirillales bacterium]